MTATAGHLISGDSSVSHHYQNALGELHKELRRPMVQQSVWSLTRSSPTDFVRSKLSVPEIQQRALSYLPDELLANVPEGSSAYSLFQGFQASVPEIERPGKRKHGRRHSRGRQLITERGDAEAPDSTIGHLRNEQQELSRRLERMGVRKYMCSSEISEIDQKIANLNNMRRLVMQRLAGLEQEEADIEHELHDVDNKLEDMEEELDGAAAQAPDTPTTTGEPASEGASPKFMSESIYEKLSSPRARRLKPTRRKSMAILHEHMERGSVIRELQAHNDVVTAIDFDAPFGTGVSAALDDTVRVWDLNGGRCIGLLEGHLSSVRCLQMEDNIVATGSMDATIRLWDLSRAQYDSRDSGSQDISTAAEEEDGLAFEDPADGGMKPPSSPSATSMQDCYLFSLEAHVAEVTALHLRGDTLVSGSADKTLRQWDLEKGRCIQTLDVLWAAAQAAATLNSSDVQWRQTGRPPNTSADFVGALQCFDAALACGTADGLIRLWDLRSGQVHRSLIGHTGPVTCLQFDDVHLVTGSLDRSIRVSPAYDIYMPGLMGEPDMGPTDWIYI